MTQIELPATHQPPSPSQMRPDPNFLRLLATQYGTLDGEMFLPATSFDLRVRAAVANSVSQAQAKRDAAVTLKTDETKRREHGISWSFVIVTAHVGNGQGEVTGVDSSDLEGIQIAKVIALLRAVEDDRAWDELGLGGN